MCGICGILNLDGRPVDPAVLGRLSAALAHRGPDDAGLWCEGPVGLAHRRLVVIDLAGGHQPMSTPDGLLRIVFNGEIYNFPDLRQEMARAGVSFRTRSDTEVLLELWRARGPATLERLNGMFAFAVHDAAHQRLFLARDRLGKKPLFYTRRGNLFAFASELHALRHLPGPPPAVRPQAVLDYLAYHYVPGPDTIFADTWSLPPGTWLQVDATHAPGQALPPPRRYWRLDFAARRPPLRFAAAAEELRALLADAVRLRLLADVPLGAFLSGGMDSACIAALMPRAGAGSVATFTIGFDDPLYDERAAARATARHLGTRHHERVVQPCDSDALRRLVRHCGQPFADASILPTFLLAQFTREQVTVALSGDGADELFGGYERYRAMRLAERLDAVPAPLRRAAAAAALALIPRHGGERTGATRLRRFLRLLPQPAQDRYFSLVTHLPAAGLGTLLGPRLLAEPTRPPESYLATLFASTAASGAAARAAEVDHHSYLPHDILTKVDIAAMACALEVRCPFLDHRVATFAAGLPWAFKQDGAARKRLLQAACRDLLPAAVFDRPKRGFGVPLATWLRGGLEPLLREVLLDPGVAARGFLNPGGVAALLEEHTGGRADHSYPLWALLVFELWCREFSP
jgi:asparagine synthase (glutamine-hydrolysing)